MRVIGVQSGGWPGGMDCLLDGFKGVEKCRGRELTSEQGIYTPARCSGEATFTTWVGWTLKIRELRHPKVKFRDRVIGMTSAATRPQIEYRSMGSCRIVSAPAFLNRQQNIGKEGGSTGEQGSPSGTDAQTRALA